MALGIKILLLSGHISIELTIQSQAIAVKQKPELNNILKPEKKKVKRAKKILSLQKNI